MKAVQSFAIAPKRAINHKAVTRHDNHVKSGELDFTIKSGNLEREPVAI
jgi:hypothetical protein